MVKCQIKDNKNYSIKRDGYKYFKELYPESNVDRETYNKIYNKIIDICDDVVFNGRSLSFFSFVILMIQRKKRDFNKLKMNDVNWQESRRLGKRVYHLDEYRGRLFVKFIEHSRKYRVVFTWYNSRKIAKYMKENNVTYPIA